MAEPRLLSREQRAQAAATNPGRRSATATIILTSPTPGRIGAVIDQIAQVIADAPGVSGQIEVPGYEKIFYGWEATEDATR